MEEFKINLIVTWRLSICFVSKILKGDTHSIKIYSEYLVEMIKMMK